MNAKHTPGPWIAEPCGHADRVDVWTGSGIGHVAAVSTGLTPDPSAKANARLIAASPELFEALETLVQRVSDLGANGFSQEVAKGKAAIAKAKGGEG